MAELRAVLDHALAGVAVSPREAAADEEVRIHRFDPLAEGWRVVAEGTAGGLRVLGRRIETLAARTDFQNAESRDRFQRMLERSGIDAELRRAGATVGTMVHIGPVELEWSDED
jgi:Obg family GTPase CgtA-like protein